MSTDFERYILTQRPFCEVTGCLRPSRYVLDAHGGNMRVVCAHHDPDFVEEMTQRIDEERGAENNPYSWEEVEARRKEAIE